MTSRPQDRLTGEEAAEAIKAIGRHSAAIHKLMVRILKHQAAGGHPIPRGMFRLLDIMRWTLIGLWSEWNTEHPRMVAELPPVDWPTSLDSCPPPDFR